MVGVSPPGSTPEASDDASGDGSAPAPFVNLRPTLHAIGNARPSLGHGGWLDAEVYANDSARQAWDAQDEMPDGAVLAEELFERRATGSGPLGLFVMTKQDQKWRFAIERGAGSTEDAGLCDSCHREAPHDGVFALSSTPVARASPPAPSAGARPADASAGTATRSVQGLAGRTPSEQSDVVDAASEAHADDESGQR